MNSGCLCISEQAFQDEEDSHLCQNGFKQRLVFEIIWEGKMHKSVLVVDEDVNMRLLYKAELQAEVYRVFTAANTKEALDDINRETFDAIILNRKFQID